MDGITLKKLHKELKLIAEKHPNYLLIESFISITATGTFYVLRCLDKKKNKVDIPILINEGL